MFDSSILSLILSKTPDSVAHQSPKLLPLTGVADSIPATITKSNPLIFSVVALSNCQLGTHKAFTLLFIYSVRKHFSILIRGFQAMSPKNKKLDTDLQCKVKVLPVSSLDSLSSTTTKPPPLLSAPLFFCKILVASSSQPSAAWDCQYHRPFHYAAA